MRFLFVGAFVGVMCFAAGARADGPDDQYEFARVDFATPDPGVDRASLTAIPWCAEARIEHTMKWDAIDRTVQTADSQTGLDPIQFALAAGNLCQKPTSPKWVQYATSLLQKWMNHTHLSQRDAERSLRARVQAASFQSQHDALCKGLELSPEIAGEVKTYAQAQRELFGCDDGVLWLGVAHHVAGVGYYLDGDATPDELARVYWLFGYIPDPRNQGRALPSNDADANTAMLYYATAAPDLARLDLAALDKELSAAPYNDYAKIIALETVGVLKGRQQAYDAAIAKLTGNDADYTAILRDAPKKAYAQWDGLVAQWKPELERSAAFEKVLSQPSHKAMKGCSPQLTKDAEKAIRAEKTNTFVELANKIAGDPIASLLLQRLAICDAVDNVFGMSGALDDLVTHHGRGLRGPRTLAHYAIVDAISTAKKDRPRMALSLTNFSFDVGGSVGDTNFNKDEFHFTGRAPAELGRTSKMRGEVASTKKSGDHTLVVFKKVKVKVADYECTDDKSHPLRVDSNGAVQYYRNCRWPGTFTTEDHTTESVLVAPELAGLAKPGTYLEYEPIPVGAKMSGVILYTKKSADAKTIDSFFGFQL